MAVVGMALIFSSAILLLDLMVSSTIYEMFKDRNTRYGAYISAFILLLFNIGIFLIILDTVRMSMSYGE